MTAITSHSKELDNLLQQATIVSSMMLTVIQHMHGDFDHKHPGAILEQLIVAFVFWGRDTISRPLTVTEVAKILRIPRSNVDRAVDVLNQQGLIREIKRQRFGRNLNFIAVRPNSTHFVEIRMAVMAAGDALRRVFQV